MVKSLLHALGDLSGPVGAALVAASSDLALVLTADGTIEDVSVSAEDLAPQLRTVVAGWRGRGWASTVTIESRDKIAELIATAVRGDSPRWRQVNIVIGKTQEIPILFSAIAVKPKKRLLALGRDMRGTAALQQRLVETQQALDRDYARLRNADARYRLLFQMSAEPIFVVDSADERILESNLAADRILGRQEAGIRGLFDLFARDSHGRLRSLLSSVLITGRAEDVSAKLAGRGGMVTVSASLFRQDQEALFLIRIGLALATAASGPGRTKGDVLRLLESSPDGFVVVERDGRIAHVNATFLELAQLASVDQARGAPLSRWLGRTSVEIDMLLTKLRERGPIRFFGTVLRGDQGGRTDIELAASVATMDDGQPLFGFSIRDVGVRPKAETRAGRITVGPAGDIADLIGRLPLKEMVRESTDIFERLAIEAALRLTNDNRASAAQILGLSRQGLYMKLRRYGIGDLGNSGGEDGA